MKETELMIGNIFECEGQILTVNGIGQGFADEPYYVEGKTKDGMFIPEINLDDCHPVKLNKDWVVDELGFTFVTHNFFKKDFFELHNIQGMFVLSVKGQIVMGFEYVHQLQNFFQIHIKKSKKS